MPSNRSMPTSTFIAELAYPDVAEAADWLCRAFGFSVRLRIADHRVQLTFHGGDLVLFRGSAAPSDSHRVMVRVSDVDAHYERAVAAGAVAHAPPASYPYGERQYGAVDPAGHVWVFSQSIADVDPASWGGVPA